MKNLCVPEIAKWRDHDADRLYGTGEDERPLCGAFLVAYKGVGHFQRSFLRVIASSGADQPEGWRFDHVSVSLSDRTPDWDEMDYIKRLFFRDEEVAYQLHITGPEKVNNHPFCLHLWRSCEVAIPLPPSEMVGVVGLSAGR